MTISFGNVPLGSVLPIPFNTFGASNESITITGLAVTDIEVYKGTSMTQRASDAGYTLMDTDGIDLDGVTGIQGFSIDTGDNTDAGFFTAGSFYWVVVSAITVNAQTVNFVAATFRLLAAENIAGTPVTDAVRISGDATAADNAEAFFDGTGYAGTNNVIPTVTAVTNAVTANVTQISGDTTAADNAEAFFDGTGYAGTNNVIPTVTTLTNLPAITANWLTAAGTAADFTTEIQSGLATAAALTTVEGKVDTIDTVVDAILADTGTDGVVIAAASRPGIRKNTALSAFEFLMTDDTNHEPAAGLTVTVTRSIDGGAFAGGTLSAVSAVSNGVYAVDFGAGDLNGNVVTLRATATGADDLFVTIKTSP